MTMKKTSPLDHHLAVIQAMETRRVNAGAAGVPALQRLVKVAQRNSGQSHLVRLFLLSVYNGYDYPFCMRNLRGLDYEIHDDCLAVLRMDHAPECEIHERIANGDQIFREFVEQVRAQP